MEIGLVLAVGLAAVNIIKTVAKNYSEVQDEYDNQRKALRQLGATKASAKGVDVDLNEYQIGEINRLYWVLEEKLGFLI